MMRSKSFNITPFHIWVTILAILIAAGAIAGVIVFAVGLSVTNLTDLVPWGLWIGIDLSSIALSAGAFLLSAAVYLLKIKRLEPVARTAVFIGLIGYSMALMTLLLDIGRPDRFWHALAFWNYHSPLWEVSMCIALYFSVLMLETAPIVARWEWLQKRFPKVTGLLSHIHHFSPILAIAGLALSIMHQSSLGAMYGVIQAKPIWYRPGLAALFIVSAMAAGPSLTVLASMITARLSKQVTVNDKLFEEVAKFIGWVLVGYLYLRFWDMMSMNYTYEPGRNEGLAVLTTGKLAINFWVGEIILGIIVPMVLLLNGRTRRNPNIRMFALLCVVGGLVAFRWDTNTVGQMIVLTDFHTTTISGYTAYVPSLIEILAGVGVIAYGFMAYTLGVRFFRIVDHGKDDHETVAESHPSELVAATQTN